MSITVEIVGAGGGWGPKRSLALQVPQRPAEVFVGGQEVVLGWGLEVEG